MLHTGIPAYANRHRILVRLVASFLLLFTTSGNVLCLKFGGIWETPWIFKIRRWTHDRCMKINKSPTVTNGVGTSSFEIWTANLAQLLTLGNLTNFGASSVDIQTGNLQSLLHCRHPKTWHFWFGTFLMLYIFEWKNTKKTCWIQKNDAFANWEKHKESWNF